MMGLRASSGGPWRQWDSQMVNECHYHYSAIYKIVVIIRKGAQVTSIDLQSPDVFLSQLAYIPSDAATQRQKSDVGSNLSVKAPRHGVMRDDLDYNKFRSMMEVS